MAAQAAPVAARAMNCTAGRGRSQDRHPLTIAGRAPSGKAADRQICATHQIFQVGATQTVALVQSNNDACPAARTAQCIGNIGKRPTDITGSRDDDYPDHEHECSYVDMSGESHPPGDTLDKGSALPCAVRVIWQGPTPRRGSLQLPNACVHPSLPTKRCFPLTPGPIWVFQHVCSERSMSTQDPPTPTLY